MKVMRLILLICLILLWTGCSQKTLVQTKFVKQEIPNYLLDCPEVNKPIAKTEKDIVNAYITLYSKYSECKNNMESIKEIIK